MELLVAFRTSVFFIVAFLGEELSSSSGRASYAIGLPLSHISCATKLRFGQPIC